MIFSMTGYGAGEAPFRDAVFSVESRSVNHRYLESSVRGPRWTLSLENEVREAVKKRFARGRFDIFIHYKESNNNAQIIDINAAKNFVTSLESLRDELGIKGEVDLALLTSFKDSLKSADTAFAA
ncbi:MAG: hypothetical protein HOG04_08210, partial [Nitrospinaceae bacterium]|nr:hypothetical protein [Nitrospinaceae bacterium]